ncbi:hypothetical protein GALMADRAFT_436303 [Galerina marginata CBS 339.88]|uniref:Uncharacterized protein n=1 Tax=Galerina marginata (strain CBS 339.88) TaxID=685588 RepID=A0A067T1Z9_GALM3|nr:hypothetical protein GALMADRAFT_436303 [Galerina marginata CBS 339.88]
MADNGTRDSRKGKGHHQFPSLDIGEISIEHSETKRRPQRMRNITILYRILAICTGLKVAESLILWENSSPNREREPRTTNHEPSSDGEPKANLRSSIAV